MRSRHMAFGAVAVTGLALGLTAPVGAQGSGDQAFFAVLTGAKEVKAGESAGDPDGRGAFSATLDGRTLCYGIQVKNIDNPVAAHIHRGARDIAGPVVQPLEQPATGDPGSVGACVRVSRTLARGLRNHPGRFYVNVHTTDFTGGAVRGQLFARSR